LKSIKEEIKQLFEEHGSFESPYDVLEELPQKLLNDYGVETGTVEETYIFQAVKERMHRDLRSGVERVFSRLKTFTGLNKLKTQKQGNVETHVLLSIVALVTASFTAKKEGKEQLMLSPSRII